MNSKTPLLTMAYINYSDTLIPILFPRKYLQIATTQLYLAFCSYKCCKFRFSKFNNKIVQFFKVGK